MINFWGVSQGLDYNRKFVFYFGLKIARFFNYFRNFNLQVLATSVCQSLSPQIIFCESIKKTSRALHAGKWAKNVLKGVRYGGPRQTTHPLLGVGGSWPEPPPPPSIPFPDTLGGLGPFGMPCGFAWPCYSICYSMIQKHLETLVLCSVPKHIPSKKIFCVLDHLCRTLPHQRCKFQPPVGLAQKECIAAEMRAPCSAPFATLWESRDGLVKEKRQILPPQCAWHVLSGQPEAGRQEWWRYWEGGGKNSKSIKWKQVEIRGVTSETNLLKESVKLRTRAKNMIFYPARNFLWGQIYLFNKRQPHLT